MDKWVYPSAEAGISPRRASSFLVAPRKEPKMRSAIPALMRPSMYGSYHGMHIQRRGVGVLPVTRDSVVAGPLCESGDVFTQGDGGVVLPRALGDAQVGDLLVIHDTGAYGASMSSNYNTRPLAAEVLVDGAQVRLIRRRQTVEELLALELGL